MENAEINNIIKILGLQYKKNYSDPESLKSLRYGKIMIMTDQVCSVSNLYSSFIHHLFYNFLVLPFKIVNFFIIVACSNAINL